MGKVRIVVIGGIAAGPKAACKARRVNPEAEITLVQDKLELSMATCGYPYYVGGEFARDELISSAAGTVRTPTFFQKVKGVHVLNQTLALAIDRKAKTVRVRNLETKEEEDLPYDKLLLATGAKTFTPPVPGVDLSGVSHLWTLQDTDHVKNIVSAHRPKRAVVVGGGLVGVETAEALNDLGVEVTLVEMLEHILPFVDLELARLVENHMEKKGVAVKVATKLEELVGDGGTLTGARLDDGSTLPCELAVLAVGVRPNSELAKEAGLELGKRGGVLVDEHMRTSDPAIYSAGDACEPRHLITGNPAYTPLGDLANLQGRVAAQNMALGDSEVYPGTVQTGICKVFDMTAGSTGLSLDQAKAAGFDAEAVLTAGPDKPHYMGAKPVILKLVADKASGRLLGMQGVGLGDVAKRLAIAATAVQAGMTLQQAVHLDLPYAPPYSPAVDPFITCAHALENKLRGRMKSMTSLELKALLDADKTPILLDVRTPKEVEAMRLGQGEMTLPLGKLRESMDKLPEDKSALIVIYCKVSLRGYEGAIMLEEEGYNNVRVLEGGLLAWPFEREA